MTDKETKIVENIDKEIERIDNSQSNVYFFVLDTKVFQTVQLSIYTNWQKYCPNNGKNVTMLYQENLIDKKDDKGSYCQRRNGNNLKKDPLLALKMARKGNILNFPMSIQ